MKPTTTGWIHRLSKKELIEELASRGLPSEGERDSLRERLLQYVQQEDRKPGIEDTNEGDNEDEELITLNPVTRDSSEDDETDDERRTVLSKPLRRSLTETTALLDTVRKWGCQFDGKDGVAFLERLEDLRESYGISHHQLRKCLPLLFKEQALLWYRNNRAEWKTWRNFEECFRQYYVPSTDVFALEEAIARRTQGAHETARDYTTAIQTLMRRHGQMDAARKLERTYYNLRPEYHLYIRRSDFRNLAELLKLADDYERARRYEQSYQPPAKSTKTKSETHSASIAATVTAAYRSEECCWNCGQRGHMRRFCRRPGKKFCARCGKEGVLTRECHGPGNGHRAGDEQENPRSDTTSEEHRYEKFARYPASSLTNN